MSTTEEPGEANNNTAESPEEYENVGGGTDKLYETIQKVLAVMPLLAISSAVLFTVFAIQAFRYHNPFVTFLALWFLVLGSQAFILFELHRVGWKMAEHCCDNTNNCVNMSLWTILFIAFLFLSIFSILAEPMFIGKNNVIEHYMSAVAIAVTVFLFIIWMFDFAYIIYEVMPIMDD